MRFQDFNRKHYSAIVFDFKVNYYYLKKAIQPLGYLITGFGVSEVWKFAIMKWLTAEQQNYDQIIHLKKKKKTI